MVSAIETTFSLKAAELTLEVLASKAVLSIRCHTPYDGSERSIHLKAARTPALEKRRITFTGQKWQMRTFADLA